jgi:hypothetical protein
VDSFFVVAILERNQMNPFDWKKDPRPSIFMKDVSYRAKGVPATTDYKAFGIFSRAKPSVKPSLNKHELPKGRL